MLRYITLYICTYISMSYINYKMYLIVCMYRRYVEEAKAFHISTIYDEGIYSSSNKLEYDDETTRLDSYVVMTANTYIIALYSSSV